MTRTCGGCTLCCKVMPVKEFPEKGHKWCEHCNIGKGCRIYQGRPQSCRDFACQWLISEDYLDDSFRPDRIGVVLTGTAEGKLVAHCDAATPMAWREPKMYALLTEGARNSGHSIARAGARFWIITVDSYWEVGPDHLIADNPGEIKVVVPYRDGRPTQETA